MPNLKELYTALRADGAPLPDTYEAFESFMTSGPKGGYEHRKLVYDALKADGAPLPDSYEEFSHALFVPKPTPAPTAPSAGLPQQTSVPDTIPGAVPQKVSDAVNHENGVMPSDLVDERKKEEDASYGNGFELNPVSKAVLSHSVQSQADGVSEFGEYALETARNKSEYLKRGGYASGAPVKGDIRVNGKTNAAERTYLTPSGQATTDLNTAHLLTRDYNENANMTVSAQLRRAGRELTELNKRRQERAAAINDKFRNQEDMSVYDAVQRDKMASQAIERDPEYRALTAAVHRAEERVKTLQHENDRTKGKDVGFWRNFSEIVLDPKTWDFGYSAMSDNISALNASRANPSGNAKSKGQQAAENTLMEQRYLAEQAGADYGQNESFWARAGVMSAEMLPFMLDFALMGGARGGSSAVSKKLTEFLTKGVSKAAPELARKKAARWTVKVLGTMPEDMLYRAPLMANTVQGAKTAADIIDRKLGNVEADSETGAFKFANDKRWGEAVWQGEANAIIENYSEMFGTHLDKVLTLGNLGKLAGVFGAKRLSGILTKAGSNELAGIAGTLQAHLSRFGVSDYFGEVGEEYYGQLWRTALDLDDAKDGEGKNLFASGQFHGDIWGGMALSMGAIGAAKYGAAAGAYASMKHRVNKAETRAEVAFGPKAWEEWRTRIDGTVNEDMGTLAMSVILSPDLTGEQKQAAMNYMETSLNLRGYNLAGVAAQRGEEPSEEETTANRSWQEGYAADSPQEMSDARLILEKTKKRLDKELENFDEDFVSDFHADPVGTMRSVEDPKLRRMMADYHNARMVVDGMEQRVGDDTDLLMERSDALIDSRINRDTGKLHPATMKTDGRKVFIVSGAVSENQDGTRTVAGVAAEEGLVGEVIVLDAETGKVEFTTPEFIDNIEEETDPETYKQAERERRAAEARKAADDSFNGAVSVVPGSVVSILDPEGNLQDVTVEGPATDENGVPVDGLVNVTLPDGSVQSMAVEQLQQMADAANGARLEEFLADLDGERADAEVDRFMAGIDGDRADAMSATQAEFLTENPVSRAAETQDVAITEDTLQESGPSTALSRVPVDENGEPVYDATDPGTAWDALMEQTDGDGEIAHNVITQTIAEKEAELKALGKQKAKSGLSTKEKIEAEKEKKRAMEEVKRSIGHWQQMAGVAAARDEEARRAEQEATFRAKAEEDRIQKETLLREKLAQETEELSSVPEFRKDTHDAGRARGFRNVDGQKVDRQPELPAPGMQGDNAVKVKFNGDNIVDGVQVVMELEDVQPTHSDGLPNPRHFVLDSQPKSDFSVDRRQHTRKAASNINPEEITGGATAFVGAPVINRRGEVYQGTGRWNILEEMYSGHRDQAEIYRNHLLLLADEGKVDKTREEIEAMNRPAAFRMTDVSDDEMVRLGNIPVDDNEAGGVKRMEPSSTVSKMRAASKFNDFVRLMLRENGEEETSVTETIRTNGYDMLKWMNGLGFINDTQFKSALTTDSRGELQLTEDCMADFRNMIEESVFEGGTQALRNSWGILPDKAKKAILLTAHRDFDSPATERVLGEIQQSVMAYAEISAYPGFRQAKTFQQALAIARTWAAQSSIDENSNIIVNGEKYSNFAIHLAALYHKETQNSIKGHFNQLYELVQGTREPSLFDAEDENYDPVPLAEAIRKVFGIEYSRRAIESKPINQSKDEDNRRVPLAGSGAAGTPGNGVGAASPRNGKQGKGQGLPAERGAGTVGDGRGGRTSGTDRENQGKTKNNGRKNTNTEIIGRSLTDAETEDFIAFMEESAKEAPDLPLTPENWATEFGDDGIIKTPIGDVKQGENQYLKLAQQGRNGKLGMVKPTLAQPFIIIEDERPSENVSQERRSSYVFIRTFVKKDGSRYYHFASITVSKEGKEVVISSQERSANRISKLLQQGRVAWIDNKFSLHPTTQIEESVPLNDSNKPTSTDNQPALLGINSSELDTSSEGGTSSISHADNTAPAISLESRGDVMSEKTSSSSSSDISTEPQGKGNGTAALQDAISVGKVNKPASEKQPVGTESSEGCTITPTKYTNKKGKTSDVWLVKFDRELSKEEKTGLDNFTREPLEEGRKTARGWYDRNQGGYMMRSEEAAKQLAGMIGNEDAVADTQPMTAGELREAYAETPVDDDLDYKTVTNADDFMKAVHHNWAGPTVHPASHGTMLQWAKRAIINGCNRYEKQLGNCLKKGAEFDLYNSEEKMMKTAGFTRSQTVLTMFDEKEKCVYEIIWHPNQYKGYRNYATVLKYSYSPARKDTAPNFPDKKDKEAVLSDRERVKPVETKGKPDGAGDFGPIFNQYKGDAQGAIKKLSEIQDGEASGALHHKDIGEIDLVWGKKGTSKSDGYGLAKLIKFHPEVIENLQEIIDDMHVSSRSENRINLESETHKAAVRLTWNSVRKKWLLTAFEKKETSESIDKTTNTDDNPLDLRGDTALSQNPDVSGDKVNSLPSDKQIEKKGSSKPWDEMNGAERLAEAEKSPLTEEEIDRSDIEDEFKTLAKAYLDGNRNTHTTLAYLKAYGNVRIDNNSSRTTGTDADAPLVARQNTPAGENNGEGGGNGGTSSELGSDHSGENVPESAPSGQDSARSDAPLAGETGREGIPGEESPLEGVSSGTEQPDGSGTVGGLGVDGRRKGNPGRGANARKDGLRGTETRPDDAGSSSGLESGDAKQAFADLLDEFLKAGRESLSLSILGLNSRQLELLPKLTLAGIRAGFQLIREGCHSLSAWMEQMRAIIAAPMGKGGFTDAEIDEWIREMWDSPFSVEGRTQPLSNWAAEIGRKKVREKVRLSLDEKRRLQKEAETVGVKTGDIDNIRATLPFLLDAQQEDVLKAETQFFDPSHADREHGYGKGYMFTNGTGTGKTYTGLGIVKRFVKQGKGRILIVTPSQQKVSDWKADGLNLGLDIKSLDDVSRLTGTPASQCKGEGAVITTFANLRQNEALMEDDFDLIVYDESHRILENKKGEETRGSMQHYRLSNKNEQSAFLRLQGLDGSYKAMKKAQAEYNAIVTELKDRQNGSDDVRFASVKLPPENIFNEWADVEPKDFPELWRIREEWHRHRADYERKEPELKEHAKKAFERTKVVFLSATPFNTRESLAYAEGYIFSYPQQHGYNRIGPRSQFYLDHFGAAYKFRYGRLESRNDNGEAISQQEVEFSDWLQNDLGTMSGRIIDSEYDYSRDFPSVSGKYAERFNEAMQMVRDSESDAVREAYWNVMGDYTYTSALFESMKATQAVERIRRHIDMGRKVVVFHRRVESRNPIRPPFDSILHQAVRLCAKSRKGEEEMEKVAALERQLKDMLEWEKTLDLRMPRTILADAFGKENVLYFSGRESTKAKGKAVGDFNSDESGKNIIVIQEASGKEGISLHDTTGRFQRVNMSLALPQSPITALQIEGRTYRIGNRSNAIFEYPLLGLDLELYHFGKKFNAQVSTTENLALGSKARQLKEAFARGVEEHSGDVPLESQGLGGKDYDGSVGGTEIDGFDRAILDFYGNQRINGRRDNREGKDYYPTPEPLGYMMVQWADVSEGESVLEPSAGHGAIARYAPRNAALTSVEPSTALFSRLQLKVGGTGRKFVNDIFENYNVVNKHDAVVMNPPFGTAGRLAVDHVAKAFSHLEEGGRVVALIPRGSTDSKFEKWYNEEENAVLVGEVLLPGITFQQAGTAVSCRVVIVDKQSNTELAQRAASDFRRVELNRDFAKIEDFFEALRNIPMPKRIIDRKQRNRKASRAAVKELKEIKGVDVYEMDGGVEVFTRRGLFTLSWDDLEGRHLQDAMTERFRVFTRKASEYLDSGHAGSSSQRAAEALEILRGLAAKLSGKSVDEMERQTGTYLSYPEQQQQEDEEDVRFRLDQDGEREIEQANRRFNEQLERWSSGHMSGNEVIDAGKPLGVMRHFMPDINITLRQKVLTKAVKKHGLNASYIKGLPEGLSGPIFVFKSNPETVSVLTQMKSHEDKNIFVAIEVGANKQFGHETMEVNDILTVHGREYENVLLPILENGTLQYVNKKKGLEWLSSAKSNSQAIANQTQSKAEELSSASSSYQQEIASQVLEDVAKIIKNFDNPELPDDFNILLEREGDGALSDARLSWENDPWAKATGEKRFSRKQQADFARRERERIRQTARGLSQTLGLEIEIAEDGTAFTGNRARAKGWYDTKTGKITVIVGNHSSVEDMEATILHEAVAHHGLRELFGVHFDEFLDKVYEAAEDRIKERIDRLAIGNGWNRRIGTEEYLASLAEEDNLRDAELQTGGWFDRIKQFFIDMLFKVGFKYLPGGTLGDNELRYVLWRSYRNLTEPGGSWAFEWEAEDTPMQHPMKTGVFSSDTRENSMAGEPDMKRSETNRTIDRATALVTGKSMEEVKARRLERERERKMLAKELYGKICRLEFDEVTLRRIDQFISDATPKNPFGRRISQRLPQRVERTLHGRQQTDGIHALLSRAAESAVPPTQRNGGEGTRRVEEKKKEIVRAYAKAKGIWYENISDIPGIEGTDEIAHGTDAVVYASPADNSVIKVKHGKPYGKRFRPDIDDIPLFNHIFPNMAYDIIGYGDFGKGVSTIVRQPFVIMDNKPVSVGERVEYMKGLGFRPLNKEQTAFTNGEIVAADIQGGNILRGVDGNIRVIDADMKLHTKEFGGTFSYPEVEEDWAVPYDLRFRIGVTEVNDEALRNYEREMSRSWVQAREALQDSMTGLKKAMQAVLGAKTEMKDIPDHENPYIYENIMSSVNAHRQFQFDSLYIRPMLEEVYKLCGKDKARRAALCDYLIARHGLERNAYMRARAQRKGYATERDFAGLTALTGERDWQQAEKAAERMAEDFERDNDTSPLWVCIRRVNAHNLEQLYLSGILSDDEFNFISGMYRNYVPLQDFRGDTASDVYAYLNSPHGLGKVTLDQTKGRGSLPEDPLAVMQKMGYDAIRTASRNVLKQRMLNFVLAHPSDLFSVDELLVKFDKTENRWKPAVFIPDPSLTPEQNALAREQFLRNFKELADKYPSDYKLASDPVAIRYPLADTDLSEHQFKVMRAGRKYIVTCNGNPRAAQALNGMTNPDVNTDNSLGRLTEQAQKLNRFLSSVYTTRNPEFTLSNFCRDMVYSNTMVWVKEPVAYALRFNRNIGKANPIAMNRLIRKYTAGTLDMANPLERQFSDFMAHGGETGYTAVKTMDRIKTDMEKYLRDRNSMGHKVLSVLGEQFDILNRSVENSARFAAYLTSVETGRSKERAAHDAKEISVNFNKKGAGDKFLGRNGMTEFASKAAMVSGLGRLFFVFFNAGVQGLHNAGKAVGDNPRKGAAALFSLTVLGGLAPLLAQMCGGGDDEGKGYADLPEAVRRSNLCIAAGDQFITVPLPIEYRAFYGLGELASSTAMGIDNYPPSEFAYHLAAQMSQLLPVDLLNEGGMQNLLPSAVRPTVEAYALNRNWTGLPIARETPFNIHDPEWKRVYSSADTHLVELSKWLNEVSGGDGYSKGAVDINPAKVEAMLGAYLGGLYSFPDKVKKGVETAAGKRDFQWRNIPMASRLVTSADERTQFRKIKNEYAAFRETADKARHRYLGYRKEGVKGIMGAAERADFLFNSPDYKVYEVMKAFDKPIKALRSDAEFEQDKELKKEKVRMLNLKIRECVEACRKPEEYLRRLTEGDGASDTDFDFDFEDLQDAV